MAKTKTYCGACGSDKLYRPLFAGPGIAVGPTGAPKKHCRSCGSSGPFVKAA